MHAELMESKTIIAIKEIRGRLDSANQAIIQAPS